MKVYISITSIFQKQRSLLFTLRSILSQSTLPNMCYIYLSEESYLLDSGFKDKIISNPDLKLFLENNSNLFEIKWVKNSGPFRKLLPLLKEKWDEDCLILTLDDDTEYIKDLVKNYITDYEKFKCCIGYRGFTMNIDNGLSNINYLKRDTLKEKYLYNFLTGKGGGLYHPTFFHNTGNLIFDEKLYNSVCKTTDDIWFNFVRIANNIELYVKPIINKNKQLFMIKDYTTSVALAKAYNFNKVNNKTINTINIQNTVKLLIKLNCIKDDIKDSHNVLNTL